MQKFPFTVNTGRDVNDKTGEKRGMMRWRMEEAQLQLLGEEIHFPLCPSSRAHTAAFGAAGATVADSQLSN